jgi:hypothetical protein
MARELCFLRLRGLEESGFRERQSLMEGGRIGFLDELPDETAHGVDGVHTMGANRADGLHNRVVVSRIAVVIEYELPLEAPAAVIQQELRQD